MNRLDQIPSPPIEQGFAANARWSFRWGPAFFVWFLGTVIALLVFSVLAFLINLMELRDD
jgi:hypothetical protein